MCNIFTGERLFQGQCKGQDLQSGHPASSHKRSGSERKARPQAETSRGQKSGSRDFALSGLLHSTVAQSKRPSRSERSRNLSANHGQGTQNVGGGGCWGWHGTMACILLFSSEIFCQNLKRRALLGWRDLLFKWGGWLSFLLCVTVASLPCCHSPP